MKKLIVVPVVAAFAAAGAASAAGFVGGVSAGPLQTGSTDDLTCADSARVIEWGTNDHLAVPNVVNARIELANADCAGQAVFIIPLTEAGTQLGNLRGAAKVADQPAGTQYVRVPLNSWPVEQVESVRITIDPGYSGLAEGGTD